MEVLSQQLSWCSDHQKKEEYFHLICHVQLLPDPWNTLTVDYCRPLWGLGATLMTSPPLMPTPALSSCRAPVLQTRPSPQQSGRVCWSAGSGGWAPGAPPDEHTAHSTAQNVSSRQTACNKVHTQKNPMHGLLRVPPTCNQPVDTHDTHCRGSQPNQDPKPATLTERTPPSPGATARCRHKDGSHHAACRHTAEFNV